MRAILLSTTGILEGHVGLIKEMVIFIVVVAVFYVIINIPEIPLPPTVRRLLNIALVIIAVLIILFDFLLPLLGAT